MLYQLILMYALVYNVANWLSLPETVKKPKTLSDIKCREPVKIDSTNIPFFKQKCFYSARQIELSFRSLSPLDCKLQSKKHFAREIFLGFLKRFSVVVYCKSSELTSFLSNTRINKCRKKSRCLCSYPLLAAQCYISPLNGRGIPALLF